MGHLLPPLSITMWPQLLLPLPLWKLRMPLVLLVLLMPSMAVRVVGSFMQPEPSTYTVIFQPFALTSVILPGDVSTLVAAAATRAAVERRVEAAACNRLGDGITMVVGGIWEVG